VHTTFLLFKVGASKCAFPEVVKALGMASHARHVDVTQPVYWDGFQGINIDAAGGNLNAGGVKR